MFCSFRQRIDLVKRPNKWTLSLLRSYRQRSLLLSKANLWALTVVDLATVAAEQSQLRSEAGSDNPSRESKSGSLLLNPTSNLSTEETGVKPSVPAVSCLDFPFNSFLYRGPSQGRPKSRKQKVPLHWEILSMGLLLLVSKLLFRALSLPR